MASTNPLSYKPSALYKRLEVTPIKKLYKFCSQPGAINFSGGLPQEQLFPFAEINVKLLNEEEFSLVNGSSLFLNYSRGDGNPELKDWVHNHIQEIHSPLFPHQSCLTIGSTDGLSNILELLDGDCVFFDKLAYASAVSNCEALGRLAIGVEMDEFGMLPESLRLQTIYAREQGLNPDCVYVVPVQCLLKENKKYIKCAKSLT